MSIDLFSGFTPSAAYIDGGTTRTLSMDSYTTAVLSCAPVFRSQRMTVLSREAERSRLLPHTQRLVTAFRWPSRFAISWFSLLAYRSHTWMMWSSQHVMAYRGLLVLVNATSSTTPKLCLKLCVQ